VQLPLDDVPEVDRGREGHRHPDAADRLITDEVGAVRDVAEVGIRTHPADPRRQSRGSVHGQRERIALRGGDVDELHPVGRARVRNAALRIQGGADGHDRMRVHVQAPRTCHSGVCARGAPLRIDVERDVAVEPLHAERAAHVAEGREHEISVLPLPHAHPPVRQIDRPDVAVHVLPFLRCVGRGRDIAAPVLLGRLTVAFDDERAKSQNPIASAERLRGALDRIERCLRLAVTGSASASQNGRGRKCGDRSSHVKSSRPRSAGRLCPRANSTAVRRY
jgi:hypothetical protein